MPGSPTQIVYTGTEVVSLWADYLCCVGKPLKDVFGLCVANQTRQKHKDAPGLIAQKGEKGARTSKWLDPLSLKSGSH